MDPMDGLFFNHEWTRKSRAAGYRLRPETFSVELDRGFIGQAIPVVVLSVPTGLATSR